MMPPWLQKKKQKTRMAANICIGLSMMLSGLWVLVVSVPMYWATSVGTVVAFKATLTYVSVMKGLGTTLLAGAASLGGFNKFRGMIEHYIEQDVWMDEATQNFCMVGWNFLKWCDMWTRTKYASWSMLLCGLLAAVFFAMGAGFTYYYTRTNATKTGRKSATVCFIIGLASCCLGVASYAGLTMDFGYTANTGPNPTSMLGTGFIIACGLVTVSWVPLYIQLVLQKRDQNEKDDSRDSDDEGPPGSFAAGPPGYGAPAGGPAGYGTPVGGPPAFPAQGYGGYASSGPGDWGAGYGGPPAMKQPLQQAPAPDTGAGQLGRPAW